MKTEQTRNTTFETIEQEVEVLRDKNESLQLENEALKFRLKQLERIVFGSRSEKIKPEDENPNQLSLFEVPVEQPEEPKEEEPPKKKQRRPGRKPIPCHLEERVEIITVPLDKTFDEFGEKLFLLGYDISERLEYVPGFFRRVVLKKERWGYRDTRDPIFIAPTPKAIVPKGKFTDSFLHFVVFQKFFMSIPLYRQIQDYSATGVEISKSVLADLIKQFSGFYRAIVEAVRIEILSGGFIGCDETHIKCQGLKKGPMKNGYFWVFRNEKGCYFQYGATKSHEELLLFFGLEGESLSSVSEKLQWEGYFLSDGAGVFDCFFEKTKVTEARCWSHARRKFFDVKANASKANWFLERIGQLYQIEKEVKAERDKWNWSEEEFYANRFQVRQDKSKAIVEEIEVEMLQLKNSGHFTPHHPMTGALNYLYNQYPKLKVFLGNGQLPIDNNYTEQSIKSSVIGRKNFLFVGSEDGGRWGASCYTLTESCRILGIDPREYFKRATEGLHQGEAPEKLTPYALKDQIRAIPKNH